MIARLRSIVGDYGPGIAVAATGVGAGDLIAASVAGAKFGTVVLWSAVVGAVIKFALNEGVARWQLATGTTLLEGWLTRLHPVVGYYFLIYLVVWSFIVAGALISACGLAAHAMLPQLSVATWGTIHSAAGAVLVIVGKYALFERMMKVFTAMMFVTVVLCAVMIGPEWGAVLSSVFWPAVPEGSAKFILGVIGGVGGSVTLLSYCYWMSEKGWRDRGFVSRTRRDLGAAYVLTGLFGVAMMIIAAGVSPRVVTGDGMALEVATRIEEYLGLGGKWMFLMGFWGAVFTSLFGVWQSVPYLFTDFMLSRKRVRNKESAIQVDANSWYYKAYLLYLAVPPLFLLTFGKPVWIILIYTIAGAMFMPFLAAMLLLMNNRPQWVGELKNPVIINALLWIALSLFGYLCYVELVDLF